MRTCPNCRGHIGFADILVPRLGALNCPRCSAELKFRGLFAWGSEVAALIASFAIYAVIEGNYLESLVALPVMTAICFTKYRFASVEVAATQAP